MGIMGKMLMQGLAGLSLKFTVHLNPQPITARKS